MKTNDPMMITGSGRHYLAAAMSALLLSGLFTASAIAQDRRGGESNTGRGREGSDRQSTMRATSQGFQRENGRGDLAINRDNSNRNFNRNQNPVFNERSVSRESYTRASNYNRDRNPEVMNHNISREKDFNRDRNIIRNSNDTRNFNANRPVSNYYNRPVTGSLNRPGYRPVYGYNRHPVYSPYNPCWRYGYLPGRNSYFYSLPVSYFSINFGGVGYRYWDGVFYRPYNNLFTVIAPPVGIYINVLPLGYRRIYVHDYPYYYYNGTYYDQRGSNYYVVSPPVGAVVESLPAGYETVVIDGETFYTADGAQYKPVIQQNGEIWYEVIKANK